MASVKGAICAICMHNPVWKSDRAFGLCKLQLQSLASRAEPGRTAPCGHRANLDLRSARPGLPRARSVSCPVLNQEVFRLKSELEVDDRFHRTPLLESCLEALQQVLPWAAGGSQCRPSNEVDSFGCAAQYDRRARADAQLRIDWKVRHSQLTPSCGQSSIQPLSFDELGRPRDQNRRSS